MIHFLKGEGPTQTLHVTGVRSGAKSGRDWANDELRQMQRDRINDAKLAGDKLAAEVRSVAEPTPAASVQAARPGLDMPRQTRGRVLSHAETRKLLAERGVAEIELRKMFGRRGVERYAA